MASGFDNDVMYADNVDFTGGSPVSGKVTLNGQLLIGATAAPNIRVNTLTGGTGIVITNGPGTITVGANGAVIGQTITGDTGGALSPTSGNWNILGQDAGSVSVMDTNGAVSTLRIEDRTWISAFVVDPSATVGLRGTFQTITAAIAAATSGQTIFIRPGTYTENFTLKDGVHLVSYAGAPNPAGAANTVTISGTITAQTTGSPTTNLIGLNLATNGATNIFVATSGNVTNTNFINCSFSCTSNAGFSIASGAIVKILNCNGILSQPLFAITGGQLKMYSFIDNGTSLNTNVATASGASTIEFYDSFYPNPINVSGTGAFKGYNTVFGYVSQNTTTSLTVDAVNVQNIIDNCSILSGTASALSIGAGVTMPVCNTGIRSTNTNAITGAGILQYSNLSFIASSSTINTTTQTPLVSSNDAVKVTTPGAYPYTTVPQDGVILVDTSSARTITPLASPTTGQMHRIKDNVGSAAANNITITPSGKNIDGAASYVINTNYGSIDIVYNGVEWSVL